MDGAAIDFRQMLKEEKKRARQKQQQRKKASQGADGASDQAMETKGNEATLDPSKYKIKEEDVEAIDFGKLKEKLQQEQSLAKSWSIPSVFDRTQHLVCSNPRNIYFLPDFLPLQQDQQALMTWLQSLPENPHSSTQDTTQANGKWTAMHFAKRRVALFDQELVSQLPAPLDVISKALVAQNIFPEDQAPNHILINEYNPGQGILPHTDGPAYFSRTATLSLGSDVLIQFTPRPNHTINEEAPTQQCLWLPRGCLLVFEDSAYLDYCHGIEDRILEEVVPEGCLNAAVGDVIQRGYRISLTFRHKKKES